LGVVFGFQGWRLAKYGFDLSTPWYGPACILLSHVFMGFSLGATSGAARWWNRGLLFGLVFGIPSAFGAHALGLRWVPYGVAAITGGMAAGLVMAFILDALFPRSRKSADQLPPVSEQPAGADQAKPEACAAKTIRQRLAEERACLEDLDAERDRRGDAAFGKTIEDRIVWGELLELELQEIDEQVSRICRVTGRRPRTPTEVDLHQRRRRSS
jgi:hypothetical protein